MKFLYFATLIGSLAATATKPEGYCKATIEDQSTLITLASNCGLLAKVDQIYALLTGDTSTIHTNKAMQETYIAGFDGMFAPLCNPSPSMTACRRTLLETYPKVKEVCPVSVSHYFKKVAVTLKTPQTNPLCKPYTRPYMAEPNLCGSVALTAIKQMEAAINAGIKPVTSQTYKDIICNPCVMEFVTSPMAGVALIPGYDTRQIRGNIKKICGKTFYSRNKWTEKSKKNGF